MAQITFMSLTRTYTKRKIDKRQVRIEKSEGISTAHTYIHINIVCSGFIRICSQLSVAISVEVEKFIQKLRTSQK